MRGARASLVRIDDEVRVVLSRQHLIRGLDDRVGEACLESASFPMRERCGLLDPDLRSHERPQRLQPADRKVLKRANGLDAVQRVVRNGKRAKWVLLRSRVVRHGHVLEVMLDCPIRTVLQRDDQ